MMVKTERKTLLRAVSKDYYDGRSFTDTSGAKRYLYINPRWQAQRRRAFLELLPGEAILKATHLLDQRAISVQMENNAASTVFTPLFLRSLNMEYAEDWSVSRAYLSEESIRTLLPQAA